jgi:hypothetical protein
MLNPAHHTTFKHAGQHSNANETFHSDQYIHKVMQMYRCPHVGEQGEFSTSALNGDHATAMAKRKILPLPGTEHMLFFP